MDDGEHTRRVLLRLGIRGGQAVAWRPESETSIFTPPLRYAALPAIIRLRRSLGSDQGRSPMTRVTRAQTPPFNPHTFLREVGSGKTILSSPNKHTIFSQGDAADAVFYIQGGKVKLTVVSQQGKEVVVAILEEGAFFGESCLAGQAVRTATATSVEDSRLVRIDKDAMMQVLHDKPEFAQLFMAYLLAHTIRIE